MELDFGDIVNIDDEHGDYLVLAVSRTTVTIAEKIQEEENRFSYNTMIVEKDKVRLA